MDNCLFPRLKGFIPKGAEFTQQKNPSNIMLAKLFVPQTLSITAAIVSVLVRSHILRIKQISVICDLYLFTFIPR